MIDLNDEYNKTCNRIVYGFIFGLALCVPAVICSFDYSSYDSKIDLNYSNIIFGGLSLIGFVYSGINAIKANNLEEKIKN